MGLTDDVHSLAYTIRNGKAFSSFKKSKSSIYATFQKLKTQFLSVMSTIRNVNLTMFVKGTVSECTRYILIYIFA